MSGLSPSLSSPHPVFKLFPSPKLPRVRIEEKLLDETDYFHATFEGGVMVEVEKKVFSCGSSASAALCTLRILDRTE